MQRINASSTWAGRMPLLDGQHREQLVQKLVRGAAQAHMTAPAILFLEMHKPLAFLGAQFLYATQPFLSLRWDHADLREVARLLEDPTSVEELIERLSQSQS